MSELTEYDVDFVIDLKKKIVQCIFNRSMRIPTT